MSFKKLKTWTPTFAAIALLIVGFLGVIWWGDVWEAHLQLDPAYGGDSVWPGLAPWLFIGGAILIFLIKMSRR